MEEILVILREIKGIYMKKELFVPFDGKGNLLDYVYGDITDDEKDVCRRNGVVIRDKGLSCMMFMPNYEFSDTMIFDGFSRGRSSVKAHFVSETTPTGHICRSCRRRKNENLSR